MNNDFVPFRPKKLWWRRLRFALRYLKNRHGFKVHSPFIFRLITQVIEEKWDYYAYQDIQTCIWEMQDSESEITVCLDGGKRGKTVPVSVFMKRYDITPSHGELLFRLCNFFHPEHILQIGAGSGLATLYLSWYAPGLNMAVIDEVNSYCSELVEELLKKYHRSVPLSYEGEVCGMLPKALDRMDGLDMIYICRIQDRKSYQSVFEKCLPKCNEKTVLVIDGIQENEDMRAFWKNVCANPAFSVYIDLFSLGIAFFNPHLHKRGYQLFF